VQKQSYAIVAVFLAAVPVVSQDLRNNDSLGNECGASFKAIDKNGDGFITRTEILNAMQLPIALAKESFATRREFMAACAKKPPTQAEQFDKPTRPSPHSTGPSVSPETRGQQQPQGLTGPLETKAGGAPAESPQGQTPPGMQPAPKGSSKTIIDPSTKE
jgi:hypothetical protein